MGWYEVSNSSDEVLVARISSLVPPAGSDEGREERKNKAARNKGI